MGLNGLLAIVLLLLLFVLAGVYLCWAQKQDPSRDPQRAKRPGGKCRGSCQSCGGRCGS
ncbi:MAG: hypothetical protein IJD21_05805 [Oscillospiraceae bacterium]|nr:hypothetical protein [Oscillospiraceae bacterium]